jgi:Uma2 family endonuclease
MQTYDSVMTEDEYLVREPDAEYKSEYRDGRVVAMSGASLAHSRINGNTFTEINLQLKGTSCRAYTADTRIKVAAARFYTYPDISVACEVTIADARDKSALLNPALIVEVLSPGTEAYDRGQKFTFYKQLDSLREYVLIAQDKVCVERFSRQDNGEWPSLKHASLDDVLELPSIGCRIALRDIYDKVEL